MKQPWEKFYIRDWLSDAALSRCSPATRGIWMDLLCRMWELDGRGVMSGSLEELSRSCRCSVVEFQAAVQELRVTKTSHVTESDGNVTVVSRRMQREYKERNGSKLRMQAMRERASRYGSVTPENQNQSQNQKQKDLPDTPAAVVADKPKKQPTRQDPHAEAFKAAFDEEFPAAYAWTAADFVQLVKWRKNYPDVAPAKFVRVARANWARGQFRPKRSLTIRGLCSDWSTLVANAASFDDVQAQMERMQEGRPLTPEEAKAEEEFFASQGEEV